MGNRKIKVSMGDGIVARSPDIILSAGLGSCMAVAIYDIKRKIGGLAHVMLPDSTIINNCFTPYQFADTAVDSLIEEMQKMGSLPQDIVAKIAGGAQMFNSRGNNPDKSIGEQNIRSIKHILNRKNIKLTGEDTGGKNGRSVEFYLDSGKLIVKSVEKKRREI